MTELKKFLFIEGDTNDSDYVSEETDIASMRLTDEEWKTVLRVIDAIKNCEQRHNWPMSEHDDKSPQDVYPDLSDDEIELFNEFIPYGEHGIHTIKRIEIREMRVVEKFL